MNYAPREPQGLLSTCVFLVNLCATFLDLLAMHRKHVNKLGPYPSLILRFKFYMSESFANACQYEICYCAHKKTSLRIQASKTHVLTSTDPILCARRYAHPIHSRPLKNGL